MAIFINMKFSLATIANDVEGVPELYHYLFILGGVLNHIFANEFFGSVGWIGFVNANAARRQRNPQTVFFAIGEDQGPGFWSWFGPALIK
jgi:hypothetical protein